LRRLTSFRARGNPPRSHEWLGQSAFSGQFAEDIADANRD
jgi:hypothetical protein